MGTAVIVYALSFKGGVQGYRLVLVGIGMAAVLVAVTDYLLTRSTLEEALSAQVWLTGTLNGRGWEHVRPIAAALVVLVPATVLLMRPLRALELGDDHAHALGVAVERTRLALIFVAVALAAVATASAGPIVFVALAAPQIARRLTRVSGPGVGCAALTGAVLLLAADTASQRVFGGVDLPVGVRDRGRGRRLPDLAADARMAQGAGVNEPRLHGRELTLAYDRRVVSEELDVDIPDGSFTAIVGPNACGKSTLLRALARMLKPRHGAVILDGQAIGSIPSKEVARRLGLLPQTSAAPDAITVSDLVARGRYPHQGILRQWSREDERGGARGDAADRRRRPRGTRRGRALRRPAPARLAGHGARPGDPLLLLDEPTTFLDIVHQLEVLDLCADLHERHGHTVVVVLHDLNHACRYATHLIAMNDGRIVAEGDPARVVDAALVERVFGLRCRVMEDPETGLPMVVPARRR